RLGRISSEEAVAYAAAYVDRILKGTKLSELPVHAPVKWSEVPFALSAYAYKVEQLRKSGAPIDWFVIPPAVARFEGAAAARRASHPNAAQSPIASRAFTISALVARLAARRTPLDEAQKAIVDAITGTESERQKKAKLVFAGLFKTLNHERSEVMRGIG